MAWGVIYVAYDEKLAGSIPLLYATGSFLSVAVFAVTMPVGFDPLSLF